MKSLPIKNRNVQRLSVASAGKADEHNRFATLYVLSSLFSFKIYLILGALYLSTFDL